MHPFFTDLQSKQVLLNECRIDLIHLPEAYQGKQTLKAILLGADPTNNGIRNNPGLIELDRVFGIGSEYEKYFFAPQQINLNALKLTKENLYIQNVCRNYFANQTSGNKHWREAAEVWLPYLAEELSALDANLPVLVTAEKIMELFIPNTPRAKDIYNMEKQPYFYSAELKREIFPLYRHPKYMITTQWDKYRNFLKQRLNE